LEILHLIDLKAGGTVEAPEPITNPDTKDRYYVSSLIEESITSSQLEGAATTRKVAKEMIRRNLKPRDTSERMIMNNYLTMKRIGLLKDRQLTPELVFDIHRSITEGTLDHPLQAGRFRTDEDGRRVVGNLEGQIFHDPPPCSELAERMSAMCDFANGKTPAEFIHPVIRSILLHFWLAYDHPFVDGNGRTARALFYWSMLRSGYWLCEYISISNIIRKSPAKYGRAYLYAETDDNDLTYFIDYHLKVIERAVQELHAYIERKTQEVRRLERKLHALEFFNQRQRAILGHALRHPGHKYTIDSHKTSHNVTHRTARLDLLELKQKGLFNAHKIGKRWYFSPALDIERKLENLADA
jgi:Fic family protein